MLPTFSLVSALRQAAQRLRDGASYAWGHHGSCNCGHLVQAITHFSAVEIDRVARQGAGEWTELAEAWCPESQAPVDLVISKLVEAGLTPSDLHHLEYLSDKNVLRHLPGGFRWLHRNRRDDVVLYFEAMATMLEKQLRAMVDGALAELEGKEERIEMELA